MRRYTFIIALFLAFDLTTMAQEESHTKFTKGIGVQLYPAGIIPTLNANIYLNKKTSLFVRLGYNIADRKDFSPYNDNEKGGGFGGTLGYRKYFEKKGGSFFAGLNTDVWNLNIDWKDKIGEANETSGSTYTLVLQPWLEGGYLFSLGSSTFHAGASIGFGREINVITRGEEVGQGWMGSANFYTQYIFK